MKAIDTDALVHFRVRPTGPAVNAYARSAMA